MQNYNTFTSFYSRKIIRSVISHTQEVETSIKGRLLDTVPQPLLAFRFSLFGQFPYLAVEPDHNSVIHLFLYEIFFPDSVRVGLFDTRPLSSELDVCQNRQTPGRFIPPPLILRPFTGWTGRSLLHPAKNGLPRFAAYA